MNRPQTKILPDGDEAVLTGEVRKWGGEDYLTVRKTKDEGTKALNWVISRTDWDAL